MIRIVIGNDLREKGLDYRQMRQVGSCPYPLPPGRQKPENVAVGNAGAESEDAWEG